MHSARLPQWALALLPMILVTGLVFIAFGHALSQDFAPIDDWYLIVRNIFIQGPTWENLKTVFTTYDPELYIPLTLFSFQLNYLAAGLHPFGYHLVNVLLHAANALLVILVLRQWRLAWLFAIIGGLIFAVHPLHTEAVVWIAGRKDSLYTFFFLLSFLLYARSDHSRTLYGLSILCFLLSLLAKINAAMLPGVILLYDLLIRRVSVTRLWIVRLMPYAMLSVLFFVISLGGKTRVVTSSTPLETILMAAKSTLFYIQKLFIPTDLGVFYPFTGTITLTDPQFFVPLLIVLAVLGMIIWQRKTRPWVSFGLLFYLLVLAPTFLNFHKGDGIYIAVDRYAYVPSIGIVFVILYALQSLTDRMRVPVWLTPALGIAIIAIFVTLARAQTRLWDSAEGLYLHSLRSYPESTLIRADVAALYRDQGRVEEAFKVLQDGLRYRDDYILRLSVGKVYAKARQIPEAREQLELALALAPQSPDVHSAIGSILEQTGKKEEAVYHYEQAVKFDPTYAAVRAALAKLYREDGKIMEAEAQLERGLKVSAGSYEINAELARVRKLEGKLEEAEFYRKRAAAIDPVRAKEIE